MGTATSRRIGLGVALSVVITAAAGCGGKSASSGWGWLKPQAPPADWHVVHIPTGATLAYPPGWHRTRGDAGTATAVLTGSDGRIVGYLNLTPRQAAETPANWATFRPHHNAQEGDRNVVTLASAGGLRFRTGRGACIRDRYTTSSGSTYIELACIVGGRTTSVIVGAASPSDWARMAPTIERSIAALTT